MPEFTFINLLLVLLSAWTMGALAERLGFPALLGELLAGILFGPALLGWLQPDVGIAVLSQVGVFLMMLYIGMEIDVTEIKQSGAAAVIAALGGFAVPLTTVMMMMRLMDYDWVSALLAGTAAAVTSLVVGSRLLVDLKLMNTRLATVLTVGALLSDTIALVIFAGTTSAAGGDAMQLDTILLMSGKIVVFFVGVVAFGLIVLPRLGPALQRLGFEGRTAHFTIVLLVALCFAELAELAGLHAILGAFLAGLFLGERFVGFKQSHELREMVHDLSVGFLVPIFFVQSGFEVSFEAMQGSWWLPVSIIGVAFVAKFAGVLLSYIPTGNGWREGVALGVGMNGRGALDLVIAGIALDSGMIDRGVFSSLVLLAIVSAAAVPILLKTSISWLRRHDQLVPAQRRSGVVLLGANPTSLAIAKQLAQHLTVRVIDNNSSRCEIAEEMGFTTICGDAMEEHVLQEASVGLAQTFIALTPNPQINLFAAQHASEDFLVPEVYTQVSGDVRRRAESVIERLSIGVLNLGAFDLTDWDRWVRQGRTREVKLPVEHDTTTERFVDHVYTKNPMLPVLILRGEQAILFFSTQELQTGDEIWGLALSGDEQETDQFDKLVGSAHILDWDHSTTYEECFAQVSRLLADQLHVDADELTRLLIEREQSDSTALSPFLAVPHVLLPGKRAFALAIVRARNGIQMPDANGSESGHSIPALFITAGTKDLRNLHLRTLSTVSQLVQDPGFEQGWLDAGGTEELRAFILETKKRSMGATLL